MSSLVLEAEIRQMRKAWEEHEKAHFFHRAEAQKIWFELIAAKNRLREARQAEMDVGNTD